MRSLNVYIDDTLVGTVSEGNNLWVFEYDQAWLTSERSFDLSPALSRRTPRHEDGGTMRPVQWYFDNLLPEEDLKKAVAKEAGIKDHEDAFALLTYLGAESAGSMTLLPPGVPLPKESELRALSNESLSQRIRDLPKQTLYRGAPKRMSMAGAQHKLLVVCKGSRLFEPVGATPSTHLLKPDHPQTAMYPASVFNEFLTMKLAQAARVPVPEVDMLYVPEPVYLIERFDRQFNSASLRNRGPLAVSSVRRLHIIDGCQLLNKDRTFKHSGATLEALAQIVERTTNPIATRQALFRWLVFNILVGNDDCHLKNLSFYVRPDSIALAPHYDMLSTSCYRTTTFADEHATWDNVEMTYPLPGASTFGQVTLGVVLAAAQQLGIPESPARRIVQEITSRVEKAFTDFMNAHENGKFHPVAPRPEDAGLEAKLLRVMAHITLKDMLRRLAT